MNPLTTEADLVVLAQRLTEQSKRQAGEIDEISAAAASHWDAFQATDQAFEAEMLKVSRLQAQLAESQASHAKTIAELAQLRAEYDALKDTQ